MEIIKLILSIIGTSFSLTGWIIIMLSFFFKISNFSGNKFAIIQPKAYLMIFFGSLCYSFSAIYDEKYVNFIIQFLVSVLNLCIYIIHNKAYKLKLKREIC